MAEVTDDNSLTKAIGQMLVYGWKEEEPYTGGIPGHARVLIDDLRCGGVIVMGRNARPPVQMAALLQAMQHRSIERNDHPLFVAVDQEGGRVNRLNPPDYSHGPSQREISASGDPASAREQAARVGAELKAAGLNCNFAPVLDVDNNPANPVIGDRSFGPDPDLCAAFGAAAVRGYQEDAAILACGKHFPGHGDTDVDSHFGLPRIAHGLDRLESTELVPFRAAVEAGVAAIMTSHILFTQIDPELPATLSPAILTGLLREKLGFTGLIITDCLEMKGVADGWGSAEAAVLAVLAGADLLLCCHTPSTQRAIRDALVDAVSSGRIPAERIEESLLRISTAKHRWLLHPSAERPLEVSA